MWWYARRRGIDWLSGVRWMVLVLRAYAAWFLAFLVSFVFQAEDGIRDLVRSRGLGDVYKRQAQYH